MAETNCTKRHQHRKSDTAEYEIWSSIKKRCENPRCKAYPQYGGRGITMCQRWRESFLAFLEDVGTRPSPELTLERKDNELGYEPGNCVWATRKDQARNRQSTRMAMFRGEMRKVIDLCDEHGLSAISVEQRLRHGWSIEDALFKPFRIMHSRTVLYDAINSC